MNFPGDFLQMQKFKTAMGTLRLNNIVNSREMEKGEIEFINAVELASCERIQKGAVAAKITIAHEFIKKKIPDIQNRVFNCKITSFYSSRTSSNAYNELKVMMHNIVAGMIEGAFPGGNSIAKANKLLVLFQKEFEDIKNALRKL